MHLKAGQFVVPGAVTAPLRVSAGDSAMVAFAGLGSLSAGTIGDNSTATCRHRHVFKWPVLSRVSVFAVVIAPI